MILTHDRHAAFERSSTGSVVSLGVFDGVHLGHQAILARTVEAARALGARPTVVTFREHPKQLLLGHAPRTLTSLQHRIELFRRAGIEHTVALPFDAELRDIAALDFARDFLVDRLVARRFVLGFDSKFGRGREGTPEYLRALGFDVEVVEQVLVGGRAVSSTAVREAVELGDLDGAARMLGRPVAVHGEVVHGDHVGGQLGFPTANLDLHHELRPPCGVYACRARRILSGSANSQALASLAVANIGFRPTLAATRPETPQVEVHLLDFEGNLYGETLELEFVRCLRAEQRFAGREELVQQIRRDIAAARAVLATA